MFIVLNLNSCTTDKLKQYSILFYTDAEENGGVEKMEESKQGGMKEMDSGFQAGEQLLKQHFKVC